MTLSALCIRRPVFTTMLVLFPVVVGVISYMKMGTDLFPNVDLPIVTITATRPGASVEEMETGVTKRIEDVVNTIAGIDEMRSTTKEGISSIFIQFVLEKNRDVAQQEVQGKINTILSQLPTGTETPIVDKFDVDATPVMTLSVSGERDMKELTEIADKQVKDSLSSLSGVGQVILVGGTKRAVQVVVETNKLEAYHLSIAQVREALASQNLEMPGGRVAHESFEQILRTRGRVERPEQFNDVIVANVDAQPVRIKDLGNASDSVEEPRSVGRLDGKNSVLLVVQKQSGANTVEVIGTVKKRLDQLRTVSQETGRNDLRMEVIRDQSRFIEGSLYEVKKSLIIGAVLVALTILLFLRDWRTMLIAATSIPVSLISTFMVMNWLGFTLNNITMLGLVLAVGVVIDDAVVVHENIFRWMEEKGYDAWEAAFLATREITLAVMATTFSLVVIFLPIAFMSGRVGRFFFSFGVTTAVAILASMLVSFTLTPMLCSRFLRLSAKARAQGAAHHSGGVYGWLIERPYLAALRWGMRHRWTIVGATLATSASVVPLMMIVGKDFIPKDDQSEFEIAITTPAGWSLERVDRTFREIEQQVRPWPGVVNVMTTIGDTTGRIAKAQGDVTQGTIYIRLQEIADRKPADGKKWDQFQLMARARTVMAQYPDLRSSVQIPQPINSGSVNADVEFNLIGADLVKLSEYADRIIQKLRQNPGLADVDTTLSLRKPELQVDVDRDKASDLGVNIQTVGATLRTLVGGDVVSDYKDPAVGELYDVWLRAESPNRDHREVIENLTIPSTRAGLIRLGNLADLNEQPGPAQIDRFARQRKITLVANLSPAIEGRPAYTTDQAVASFQDEFDRLYAPADYMLIAGGRAKTQNESNSAFVLALVLSLVFMYMILAGQFESFVHPITILLAVPLTIPFALLSLVFLQQALNIYSILGVFLLFGIVKKNGILQIDYTNVLRKRAEAEPQIVPPPRRSSGWDRWAASLAPEKRIRLWAIMEANRTRLRPILMTTLMLIAGMVPIALGQGPGAASRASMAKVIVGGQALSLLLSLLVTPVAYSLFDDFSLLWRRRTGKVKTPVSKGHPQVERKELTPV